MTNDASKFSPWPTIVAVICFLSALISVTVSFSAGEWGICSADYLSLPSWFSFADANATYDVTTEFLFLSQSLLAFGASGLILGFASFSTTPSRSMVILGCLVASFVMNFWMNLFVWCVGWVGGGVFCALLIGTEAGIIAPVSARRFLSASVFLDGLFVLFIALQLTSSPLGQWDWSWYRTGLVPEGVASEQEAAVHNAAAGFYLSLAVLARCGLFPFHGWTSELSTTSWQTIAIVRIGLFVSPVLLLMSRFWPSAWGIDEHSVASLTQTIGAMTVIVGSAGALLHPSVRATLISVMTVQLGMYWLSHSVFDIPHAISYTPLVVAALIGLDASRDQNNENGGSAEHQCAPRWLGTLAGVALLCFHVDFAAICLMKEPWLGSGLSDIAIRIAVSVACVCTATAIVRLLLLPSPLKADSSSSRRTIVAVTSLLAACPAIWVAHFVNNGWAGPARLTGEHVAVFTLLATMAFAIGWFLFRTPSELPAKIAKLTGPFGRLAKQGFYIDDAVFFLLTMPLRGLAQIARLMDWLVVENIVVGVPSKYPAWIAKVAAPLRQPSAGLSLLSTCVGLGVMLVIVVLLWS